MVAHNCHGKTKTLTAKKKKKTKPHGKNKIPHDKTKSLTAKTKTSRQKPKTSRQNQICSQQKQNSFGFAVSICFCREVFGFCSEVFGFAVRSLFLLWGFWFCRGVCCFCREVFGFAVRYFVFAVRFLLLRWQLWATVGRSSGRKQKISTYILINRIIFQGFFGYRELTLNYSYRWYWIESLQLSVQAVSFN